MTIVQSRYMPVKNDLYETERWATCALDHFFPVKGAKVWEPFAGRCAMADVLLWLGADVVTSDIVSYDRTIDFEFDFLRPDVPIPTGRKIISNPPYGKRNAVAVECARLSLRRASFVALLLTAKFDFASTRSDLFRDNPRFTAKINLVDRIRWFEGDSDGTEDHAWYVWTERRMTPDPAILYAGKSTAGRTLFDR